MAGIVKISSYKSWNNPSWHMNTNWLELCYSSVLSTKPFKNMNRVSPAEDTTWKQKKNTNIAGNSSFSFLQTMFLQLCKIYWTALADIWYILDVKLLWIVLISCRLIYDLRGFLILLPWLAEKFQWKWLKMSEFISQTQVIDFGESLSSLAQCFLKSTNVLEFFCKLMFFYISASIEVLKF